MSNNPKGTVSDIALAITLIFIVGVAILVGGVVMSGLQGQISDNKTLNVTYFDRGVTAFDTFNNMFSFFVFIGLGLGIVTLVLTLKTHPVFAVASIIGMIILIWVAAMFGNFYQDIGETEGFTATAERFDIISLIFENMVTMIIALTVLTIILLYAKGRDTGGV